MISEQQIVRKKTRKIYVGDVPIGGDSPISVQSMTNTLTADSVSTIRQIQQLHAAGADIVRVSVPDKEAADPCASETTIGALEDELALRGIELKSFSGWFSGKAPILIV